MIPIATLLGDSQYSTVCFAVIGNVVGPKPVSLHDKGPTKVAEIHRDKKEIHGEKSLPLSA
jgi:hypothetical protein